MFKKKINFFISFLLLVILSLIIYISINHSLRRSIFNQAIGGYKLINYHIIGGYAFYKNFDSASKKILNYIEFSQNFSEGKNSLLEGIIDSTELMTSKAYTQEHFNQMERVFIKINDLTDDIYKNHIWLARALSDNDIEKSRKHLIKALELSTSSEEVYREIIRIFSKDHDVIDLLKSYCKNYFTDFGGSSVGKLATSQTNHNFFYGSNSNFGISVNENLNKLYSRLINDLNEYKRYEFVFENAEDLKQFYIFKNFFSGSKVSIKDIILFNKDEYKLDIDQLIIHSSNSYILNNTNEEIIFLNSDLQDDILKFNFKKKYKKIKKISFKLKLERLALTNNSSCRKINEN